jgi:hypothetical protein
MAIYNSSNEDREPKIMPNSSFEYKRSEDVYLALPPNFMTSNESLLTDIYNKAAETEKVGNRASADDGYTSVADILINRHVG